MNKILSLKIVVIVLLVLLSTVLASAEKYKDGRPEAILRMDAKDHGIVLRYGDGLDQCDILGARDVWVFETICTTMPQVLEDGLVLLP